MKGAVNYSPFLEASRGFIEDPKALGWLSGHNMDLKTAKGLGMGFYDPNQHLELTGILNAIYQAQGFGPLKLSGSWIIIPYEGSGYFIGIPADKDSPMVWNPRAGSPKVWNEPALWSSEGEPVFIVSHILDALALRSIGLDVVYIVSKIGPLADTIRARPSSGPLVMIPQTSQETDRTATLEIVKALRDRGAPVLCYDFSNHGAEYPGAMEILKTDGTEALRGVMKDLRDWAINDLNAQRTQYLQGSAGAYIETFKKLIGNRTGREATPTGFKTLDRLLDGGLYPGLYIIGAVSSLGKTTFSLQIADYIAEQGRDVLFFTLEQSRDELISKSLARLTASYDWAKSPLTSRQILYKMKDWLGTGKEKSYEVAILNYADSIGPRMFIVEEDRRPRVIKDQAGNLVIDTDEEGNPREEVSRIGLDTIRDRIREHISITGRVPIVFIDYLQILRPEDDRGSDKQNIDTMVSELRRLSKTHKVPIIAISSLNRGAYGQPVRMESFKESGAIEYSSDVLIGLGPSGLSQGEQPKDLKKNRETFEDLREQENRPLEAVILKNRMGTMGKVPLVLNAPYGLFIEGELTQDPENNYPKL